MIFLLKTVLFHSKLLDCLKVKRLWNHQLSNNSTWRHPQKKYSHSQNLAILWFISKLLVLQCITVYVQPSIDIGDRLTCNSEKRGVTSNFSPKEISSFVIVAGHSWHCHCVNGAAQQPLVNHQPFDCWPFGWGGWGRPPANKPIRSSGPRFLLPSFMVWLPLYLGHSSLCWKARV
jgi:hypothetical protein